MLAGQSLLYTSHPLPPYTSGALGTAAATGFGNPQPARSHFYTSGLFLPSCCSRPVSSFSGSVIIVIRRLTHTTQNVRFCMPAKTLSLKKRRGAEATVGRKRSYSAKQYHLSGPQKIMAFACGKRLGKKSFFCCHPHGRGALPIFVNEKRA